MLIVLNGVSSDPSAAAASADAYSRAFDRMMFRCLSTHRSRPTKARPSRTTHRVSAPMTSRIARRTTPRDVARGGRGDSTRRRLAVGGPTSRFAGWDVAAPRGRVDARRAGSRWSCSSRRGDETRARARLVGVWGRGTFSSCAMRRVRA